MWNYAFVTRNEFESVKDKIENFIVLLGGVEASVDLQYERKTTSIFGGNTIVNVSVRPVFTYNGLYYQVNEVCFLEKPFIVIERGTYNELINNIMDETEPFPYDLTDDELLNEVKYSPGIEPYPESCKDINAGLYKTERKHVVMKNEECFHSPSDKKTFAGRFIDFLLRKNKLCYKGDNTALCDACKACIMPPAAYSHSLLIVSYFAVCALFTFFVLPLFLKFTTLGIFELVVIWFTVLVGGSLVAHKVVSAFILAFGWREYGENDYTAEELENKKKRTDYLKFTALIFGAMLAFFALKGLPMLIISLAFAACCVVASISHKSTKPIVVSWVSLVLSLAAICFF